MPSDESSLEFLKIGSFSFKRESARDLSGFYERTIKPSVYAFLENNKNINEFIVIEDLLDIYYKTYLADDTYSVLHQIFVDKNRERKTTNF